MKITITATEKLTTLDGVRVRLWEGITEQGVGCKVFIHRIAVHNSKDQSQFAKELKGQLPPDVYYDLTHILL